MHNETPAIAETTDYAIRARWKSGVDGGFTAIPNTLLKNQKELRISPNELTVLLHVIMCWWTPEQNPYPSAGYIANRMDASTRTVERHLAALANKGLIARVKINEKRSFDLTGLVKKLEEFSKSEVHIRTRQSPTKDFSENPR